MSRMVKNGGRRARRAFGEEFRAGAVRLVLEEGKSAGAVARRAYFFLPGITWFMRTKLATSAKLEKSSAPLLVLHCASDPVIDSSFGEEVFRRARQPKQFLPLRGACHEGAFFAAPEECRRALRELFARMARP